MSTDKTLADVQPGGRVRLGDQAERAPWRSMDTCPRDGTVVRLRWGEDHVSPGWWSAPVSPVQNDDGTWPSDTGGFPWAFIDFNNGSAFVNHAVDTEYGPTHWAPYAALSAQPSPGGQGESLVESLVQVMNAQYDGLDYLPADVLGVLNMAVEALAARQPVGEPDEPIFQVKHHDDTEATWRDATEAAYEMQPAALRRIVYAAQPAQAVDLGQFRDAVLCWRREQWSRTTHVPDAESSPGDNVERADRLLALIDSQVVGNG